MRLTYVTLGIIITRYFEENMVGGGHISRRKNTSKIQKVLYLAYQDRLHIQSTQNMKETIWCVLCVKFHLKQLIQKINKTSIEC